MTQPAPPYRLIIMLALWMLGPAVVHAQEHAEPRRAVNIIIASRIRNFDLASFSFQAQAGIQKLFHRRQLYVVYADSLSEAAERIHELMQKKHARIKNLWFDSHGHFGRRVSLFEVGADEINYQTIHEPWINLSLRKIGAYCDSSSIIAIGSCYAAATFTQPALDSFPEQRMQGDSLMKYLSERMGFAKVYGSKSWVMTKLFIFGSTYALAGGPVSARFHDPLLLPAWETLGEWTAYEGSSDRFYPIHTVAMDARGNIRTKKENFLDHPRRKKQQQKTISKLKHGNYAKKWFVKYRYPKHYAP